MSTAKRRRGKSFHLELPAAGNDEKPLLAALFLVRFDVKAGYTIAWRKSIAGLELAESVEFKSLPSGLHNIKEDLVYFMHDDEHVGISAFVNKSIADLERNALMLAVGALVPLSHGRLGRSWKHAEGLKELAEELIKDPTQTHRLEQFWNDNRLSDEVAATAPGSSSGSTKSDRNQGNFSPSPPDIRRTRNRAISSASGLAPLGQKLSPRHPAISLPSLLDTFGPLIYPLYKAALLRKRILMISQAPVELPCNFVYDISVLSFLPSSISELLPLDPLPLRLRPLFSIGVHDIEKLSRATSHKADTDNQVDEQDPEYGWIACTTDDVLAMKTRLYDVLVIIPPPYTKQAREKVWPKVSSVAKVEIRASQRDLRRYRTLRQGLKKSKTRSCTTSPFNPESQPSEEEDDQTTLLPKIRNTQETFDDASSTIDEKMIEPSSWSSLAYSSFMWWASAGEKREDIEEEVEHDSALFCDLNDYSDATPGRPTSRRRSSPNPKLEVGDVGGDLPHLPEMAIIAYFHRLTTLIMRSLADIIETWDSHTGDEGERREGIVDDETILVRSEDMTRMGLDAWSESDRSFVQELIELYWGRNAQVQGVRVECCGVRIV